jgi:hypothetical protein
MIRRPRSHSNHRSRLGIELLEDRATPTVSTITANFNGVHIDAGDTIWFTSAGQVSGLGYGTTSLRITDVQVSFAANGTTYTVDVPDTTVTFTSLATSASAAFTSDGWLITAPPVFSGNVFLGGASLRAPSSGGLLGGLLGGLGLSGGFPGGIQNVTWTANFAADTPGLTVNWKWAAAVYTNFSSDPANLGVKAVDDPLVDAYRNADLAGTPESYKRFVTAGARGNGGSNYTGTHTSPATVRPEAPVEPAILSGTIFAEYDGEYGFSSGDAGIAGVEVILTSTDYQGNPVWLSVLTDDLGNYSFTGLLPGTYTLEKVTPGGYNDGSPFVGTVNGVEEGSAGVNSIMDIDLLSGQAGVNHNFELHEELS